MDKNSSAPMQIAQNNSDALRGTHRFTHGAMATIFEIACVHEDASYAGKAAQAAFDLIDRIETELSRHRSSSDISRISQLMPGLATQVGPWTMECLLTATYFYQETKGAFDISLGSGLEGLELMPRQSSVRIRGHRVRLDLGGIGKGYAIDRAAELLEEWGISRALLHGGFSSVRALDAPPECDGWPLTLSLPGAGGAPVLRRISAERQSWSGSGIRKKDHIVDPRSGIPIRHRPGTWVSGKQEALAAVFPRQKVTGVQQDFFETGDSPSAVVEALSTAFMIMPLDEVASYCLRRPGIEAYILNSDPDDSSSMPLLASFTR